MIRELDARALSVVWAAVCRDIAMRVIDGIDPAGMEDAQASLIDEYNRREMDTPETPDIDLTPAESFIAAARALVPGISGAEIARRIGVSRAAVSQREFSAPGAVERWNAAGHPPLRWVAPVAGRVEAVESITITP